MIINPRAEQNERQIKIQKSRMYKQMLDNQILGNERYRKQHTNKSENNDSLISLQSHFMPIIQRKKTQNLESSFVYQTSTHNLPSKKVNLPVLVDKNTFYRGSSRFIKVEQPQPTSKNKKKHIQTELIQEQLSDDDQYNSTCEKIIQQLQNIIRQPSKPKYRKRYNEFSQHSHYRRNPAKNKQSSLLFQTGQRTAQRKYKLDQKPQSINSQIGSNRLFSRHTKTEKKYSNENANEFEDDNDLAKNQTQSKQPQTRGKNIATYKVQFKEDNIDNLMRQKSGKFSQNHKSVNHKKTDQQGPKQIKSTQRQINPVQKEFNPSEYLQTKFKTEQHKTDNNSSKQRQKFLEVLRKVKIRGQSLYLKVSKLPTNESFLQND